MTEAEWLGCTDPGRMLKYVRRKVSVRKLRLFAVGCSRIAFGVSLELTPNENAQLFCRMAEIAERMADGTTTELDLRAIQETERQAEEIRDGMLDSYRVEMARAALDCIHADAYVAASACSGEAAEHFSDDIGEEDPDEDEEMQRLRAFWQKSYDRQLGEQAALVREIVNNPFHPAALASACLTPTIIALAQTAYDERSARSGTLDGDRLAVLADALEDAGCNNAEILEHLRSPDPHVRGCWALDLVLDKR